jgi:L-lactate dehydrogenase (cytochrome)
MSVADAKRAAAIGRTGIILSNHGGRQLDGSRASYEQLAEVVDAVGDRIDVMMDGGVQRGTHVLKALSGCTSLDQLSHNNVRFRVLC